MWLLKNAIIDPLKNAIESVQKGVNYIIMMLNINGFNYKCLILCYLDVYHITHNIVIHSPPDMSELCLCITYTCMYSKYIHVYYLHSVTIYNPYKLPTPGFATGDAQWWSITAEVPFFYHCSKHCHYFICAIQRVVCSEWRCFHFTDIQKKLY